MSMTSPLTITLFWILGGGGLLGILLMWGKIYRRGLKNLIMRTLALLFINIFLLIAIGLSFNKSQGFYADWSDLFGSGVNYESKIVNYSELIPPKVLKSAVRAKNGYYIIHEVIKGKYSGVSNKVLLLLPPSAVKSLEINQPLNPKKYAFAEFLTGFPAEPEMWLKMLNLHEIAQTFNVNNPGRELVGIIPQVNIQGSVDLECMNISKKYLSAETWLAQDVKHYATTRLGLNDEKLGLAGVSTGGWCAAMLAIKHPDLYSGAVSIAGYYRPALPRTDPQEIQDAMNIKYDLGPLEERLTETIPIYLMASKGDKYSFRETQRYLSKSHPHLAINYHEIQHGAHNFHVWRNQIEPGLSWLFSQSRSSIK